MSTRQGRPKTVQNQTKDSMGSIKKFFKRFWAVFAALGGFLIYLLVNRKKPSTDLPAEIRSSTDQFANDVNSVRSTEKTDLEAEAKKHAEKTAEIKKKYEDAKEDLDAATQRHAEEIFEQHKDDPNALAEELSRVTGFRVVFPKE